MGIDRRENRPKKPWRVQYNEATYVGSAVVPVRKTKYFSTKALASNFLAKKNAELEGFKAGMSKLVPVTMERFVKDMMLTHFSHRSKRYFAGERGRLVRIGASWKGVNLHEISHQDIQAFLYKLSDGDKDAKIKGVSSKTVKNYHGLLSLLFRHAKLRNHIREENPMTYVPAPKVVARREVLAMSELELADMIRAGQEERWNQVVKVALILIHTGMRLGELLRVRVERDVDLASNCLRIRSVEGAETKNRKPRMIPLTPVARNLLSEIRVGPIWSGTARMLDHQFRLLGSAITVHLHAHRFRHTFCSLNLAAGVPEPVVVSWLGHGSATITKRYTHMSGLDQQYARLEVGKKLASNWPHFSQNDDNLPKVNEA
jgi:integrase